MLPLVLDLLLLDETNPRSLAFQLAALSRHIDTLPQSGEGGGRTDEQRTVLSLLTQVRGLADRPSSPRSRPDGTRAGSAEALLGEQVAVLPSLSDDHRAALLQPDREGCALGAGAVTGGRMIYDVSHRTTYAYRTPVLQSQHLVHLSPRGRRAADRATPQPAHRAGAVRARSSARTTSATARRS